MDNLIQLLTGMADSQLRSFRHTATFAGFFKFFKFDYYFFYCVKTLRIKHFLLY